MSTLRKRIASISYDVANLAVGERSTTGRPVFVTGNGRSGTSWIGGTLGHAENVLYYREPCHPKRNGFSPATANSVWARYVRALDTDPFFEHTLDAAFKGKFWRGSGYDMSAYPMRVGQRPRILIKEVASFLSLEWLVRRWDPHVLIIMRHPGAYAASVRRLRQTDDEVMRFQLLRDNLQLQEDYLEPLMPLLARIKDPFEAMIASWAIRTGYILHKSPSYPDWKLVHYEDVARDPMREFRQLYEHFGFTWSDETELEIRSKSTTESEGQFTTSRVSHKHINAWRNQLSKENVSSIRHLVEAFELPLYGSAEDWL